VAYIKRVVGLPGDRLSLDGGVLSINGKVVQQQPSGDFTWQGRKAQRLREPMPNGVSYEILRVDKAGPPNTVGPFFVPAASYFVMGDNRDNSLDSRSWNEGRGGSSRLPTSSAAPITSTGRASSVLVASAWP
jgi:signal peptidase I